MDSSLSRTQELWPLIRQRLDTQRMRDILGGAQRIYTLGDDFSKPEGAEGTAWGRVVILRVTRIWPVDTPPDTPRPVHMLLRVEHTQHRSDFDVNVPLEAAHVEAFLRLQDWEPKLRADGQPLRWMTMAEPFFRQTAPSDPQYDRERNLWFSSAEWRCSISNDTPPS